jgi:salicylate hydroxylase
VLVGDASHALSGAGFAMEDGSILAQSLALFGNDLSKALPQFDEIRLPYYQRMYAHLEEQRLKRTESLGKIETPTEEDRVRSKVIETGGKDMRWIYENDIGKAWENALGKLGVQSPEHVSSRLDDSREVISAF